MSDKKCTLINASDPPDVRFVWPYVRHYILDASERAKEMDELHILGAIFNKAMHLFVATIEDDYIGAMTVEIQQYPLMTVGQIVHLGSKNFNLMATEMPTFVNWLRAQGATKIRMHGRKGFMHTLLPLGFEAKYYVMEKPI